MPWHTFRLSSKQLSAGDGQRALDQFEAWFIKLRGTRDVAMFRTQLPWEDFATYYLTPATETRVPELLASLQARPGEPPPEDATLVAGVAGAKPSGFSDLPPASGERLGPEG